MAFANAGGFLGIEMPEIGFVVFAPEPLSDSARFLRLHTKIMRNVLRTVLMEHHRDRLPKHFQRGAKERYGYRQRTAATNRIKQAKYKHDVELVGSGRTRRSMLNTFPKVQISGKGNHVLEGRVRYRFPFPISRDAQNQRHITMAEMGKEISKIRTDEKIAMVNRFAELYAAELRYELKSRPKIRMALDSAGISY